VSNPEMSSIRRASVGPTCACDGRKLRHRPTPVRSTIAMACGLFSPSKPIHRYSLPLPKWRSRLSMKELEIMGFDPQSRASNSSQPSANASIRRDFNRFTRQIKRKDVGCEFAVVIAVSRALLKPFVPPANPRYLGDTGFEGHDGASPLRRRLALPQRLAKF